MHRPDFTVLVLLVTGFGGRRVQLEVLQGGHDVLDVAVLLADLLPQLRAAATMSLKTRTHMHTSPLPQVVVAVLCCVVPAASAAAGRRPAPCTRTC